MEYYYAPAVAKTGFSNKWQHCVRVYSGTMSNKNRENIYLYSPGAFITAPCYNSYLDITAL